MVTRLNLAAALLIAVFALSGCSLWFGGEEEEEEAVGLGLCGPVSRELPCAAGVERGVAYPYVLYTHCGVLSAYFDGRLWLADPPLTEGSANPPRGWGNPSDEGTMTLVSAGRAEFRSARGNVARFVPAHGAPNPAAGCE
jgi:hypothetical protein